MHQETLITNQDGATVEADFVKTLQSMNESSTYLGLDGMTIVTEQFTVDLTKIKQSAPKPAPAPKPAA